MKTPLPICVADNDRVFLSKGRDPGIYGIVF